MVKHICPCCSHQFEVKAKKKSVQQVTIERDGKTYYAHARGDLVIYASFPDDGKPRKIPSHIKAIKAARARGEMREGFDWFPAYMAGLAAYKPQRIKVRL